MSHVFETEIKHHEFDKMKIIIEQEDKEDPKITLRLKALHESDDVIVLTREELKELKQISDRFELANRAVRGILDHEL